MVNRQRIAFAVVAALSLLPMTAQAGAGGTPTAAGAGKSTDYCCLKWEKGESPRRGDDNSRNAPSFVNGEGCQAFESTDVSSANACPGTVVKCRGEFFTPSAQTNSGLGKVERCLTP